jgi:RNA polymerase sigma-70 factor (ECF subfamily)
VSAWAERGPPANPAGWIVSVARNHAIDRLRRRTRLGEKVAQLSAEAPVHSDEPKEEPSVPDERLRLIFTCCHPALALEAQVALTLRTLGGLTTEEIARAFLLPSTTLAQRLVRAKAKIREANIPYRVPEAGDLAERLDAVLAVLYLVFNEGYSAAQGDALVRRELCAEAIRLAELLRQLLHHPWPELDGLCALMLLHDARRDTRTDEHGDLVLLEDQDRTRWDRPQIEAGSALVQDALRGSRGAPGPYALQAAIAAVHANAARAIDTDWPQLIALYDILLRGHPSPVIALNRAVAVAMSGALEDALGQVDALAESLADYHLWHATRADLLRRSDRRSEAEHAYRAAWQRTQNAAERRFLERRIREVGG